MDKYLQENKAHWNELTTLHENAGMYDIAGFKAGKCTLKAIELVEVGDVKGKSLLHLQCHFGMDTMSWVRRGVKATGVDFSDKAITLARTLSKETGIKADFIESDVYALPRVLDKKFDIVFTSYGVLCWLPDLSRWAQVIAHFLKPGGFFYIIEGHPFVNVFDNSDSVKALSVRWSYFNNPEWLDGEPSGDYADHDFVGSQGTCEWAHPLGDVVTALIQAGLQMEFLHEFATGFFKAYPFMTQSEEGPWHLDGDKLPLTFSLKAVKPVK